MFLGYFEDYDDLCEWTNGIAKIGDRATIRMTLERRNQTVEDDFEYMSRKGGDAWIIVDTRPHLLTEQIKELMAHKPSMT